MSRSDNSWDIYIYIYGRSILRKFCTDFSNGLTKTHVNLQCISSLWCPYSLASVIVLTVAVMRLNLNVILICISLMARAVAWFLIRFSAMSVSCFESYLFILWAHLLTASLDSLFSFFFLSICMLCIWVLCQMHRYLSWLVLCQVSTN